MKKPIIFLISLLLMSSCLLTGAGKVTETNSSVRDSIKILSSPDLAGISARWASEYNLLYPDVKIRIISISGSETTEKLLSEVNIGLVSEKYLPGSPNHELWKVVIGRDVIVPLINSKNPFADDIFRTGISPECFAEFFNNSDSHNWGTLLKNGQNSPVKYFWINDETIKNGLAGFLKTDLLKTAGIEVADGAEMITAIQNDINAIGFCKMTDVMDLKSQKMVENVMLLPIDRNGNGIIDYNEKIYNDLNVFSRGVWIGKYPKQLYSNIYSISSIQPVNEKQIAFLKWVVTDGQQFLYSNGYTDLLITERQSTVDKLYSAKIYAGSPASYTSVFKTIILITSILIFVFIIVGYSVRKIRHKSTLVKVTDSVIQPAFDENSVSIPKGIYYDKTHTWAFMEQNGVVKVGIDDFLQHVTGTITRIKMKNQGENVKKGELILSVIQNGKQLNLYAPVSGTILEQNKNLDKNSSIINSSPYNEGWIYKIEPTNWFRENQLLFMADKHKNFIKNEFSRLRDFLSVTLNSDNAKYATVILQDGGELKDGILSNLGPEVWDDFQTKFIDPSRQIWFYELF